ncbi:MAG TPA: hypothetical protein VHO71_04515 [Caproiciproducens sp.]|nr:hypothetical protein [Caproiciproducens sp.]
MDKDNNLQEKIYNAKVAIADAINEEAKRKGMLNPESLTALSDALKSLFEVQPSNMSW